MPSRAYNFNQETMEDTTCRLEMIVRHIYYLAKDAEAYGSIDYNTLEDFTNSLLYTALEFEKKIKRISNHKPTWRPPVHGNEVKYTRRLKENLREQYENLRKAANDRIRQKDQI